MPITFHDIRNNLSIYFNGLCRRPLGAQASADGNLSLMSRGISSEQSEIIAYSLPQ